MAVPFTRLTLWKNPRVFFYWEDFAAGLKIISVLK
jgi:hypothetical protein